MWLSDLEPLNCNELVELVTDYLEDTLPASERARFDAHLSGCRGCRAYLEQMRQTITLTGRLREDDLPTAARDDLLRIFHNWKRES